MVALTRRRLLAAMGGTAFASLAGARVSLSADGKVLRIRTDLDMQSLDPGWMIGGLAETTLQHACLGTLGVYESGESWEWRPSAFVETLEQVDGRRIDFRLRKGIQWSGSFGELTAEDVKYSIDRIADPKNQAAWAAKWAALDHVEVADSHSGTIVLKEPFAPIWFTTICHATASFVCKKAVEAKGGRFTTEFPATCGPYAIAAWVPKQRIELALNPQWSGPRPAFERIDILPIEDEKAAELAYDANELDLTVVSIDSLPRIRQAMPERTALAMRPGTFWTWVGMNTEHPKLQDIRVRQAIQRAIDVQGAVDAAYFGVAERATGIVAPSLIGHRKIEPMQRDVEAAKALLAEAGVSGLTLTIDVGLETEFKTIGQIVQASLAEAGIDVVINERDSGTFWTLGDRAANPDWKNVQLILNRFSMTPDPSYATEWFTPEQIGIWNWEGFNSAEFAELHKAAKAEKDTAKRAQMYEKMQTLME
ncbi:MAG TPA: ABC transporter substrate-binding protein, partial [Dongiaceae bacterium]